MASIICVLFRACLVHRARSDRVLFVHEFGWQSLCPPNGFGMRAVLATRVRGSPFTPTVFELRVVSTNWLRILSCFHQLRSDLEFVSPNGFRSRTLFHQLGSDRDHVCTNWVWLLTACAPTGLGTRLVFPTRRRSHLDCSGSPSAIGSGPLGFPHQPCSELDPFWVKERVRISTFFVVFSPPSLGSRRLSRIRKGFGGKSRWAPSVSVILRLEWGR